MPGHAPRDGLSRVQREGCGGHDRPEKEEYGALPEACEVETVDPEESFFPTGKEGGMIFFRQRRMRSIRWPSLRQNENSAYNLDRYAALKATDPSARELYVYLGTVGRPHFDFLMANREHVAIAR